MLSLIALFLIAALFVGWRRSGRFVIGFVKYWLLFILTITAVVAVSHLLNP